MAAALRLLRSREPTSSLWGLLCLQDGMGVPSAGLLAPPSPTCPSTQGACVQGEMQHSHPQLHSWPQLPTFWTQK